MKNSCKLVAFDAVEDNKKTANTSKKSPWCVIVQLHLFEFVFQFWAASRTNNGNCRASIARCRWVIICIFFFPRYYSEFRFDRVFHMQTCEYVCTWRSHIHFSLDECGYLSHNFVCSIMKQNYTIRKLMATDACFHICSFFFFLIITICNFKEFDIIFSEI